MELMDEVSFPAGGVDGALEDFRLAPHATSVAPVWLWSPDGTRVLWANPAGCAAFAAATFGALASRRFDPRTPSSTHMARLAATLPPSGAVRLERLRGFPGSGSYLHWRPLLCACSRFTLGRGYGILVVATEPVGPPLALAERVRRLELDREASIAAFAVDGTILFATEPARRRLGDATGLHAIMAEGLAATALSAGVATGPTAAGAAIIRRIGDGASTVLLARFAPVETTGGMIAVADGIVAPAAPEDISALPRHPLRFVWQMDAVGRFTLGSDEFTEIIGSRTAFALGRPWQDINAELGLDPPGRVANATATRETWSAVTVSWPVDDSAERLEVELSGLPIFDRHRNFVGYRGFGVCRDLDRIASVRAMRRLSMIAPVMTVRDEPAEAPPSVQPAEHASVASHQHETRWALPRDAPVARNVVPFPGAASFADARASAEPKRPVLSPGEHNAFRELARQLTARLQDGDPTRPIDERPEAPHVTQTFPAVTTDVAEPSAAPAPDQTPAAAAERDQALLDRLPIGIFVHRHDRLLFANHTLLEWTGYPDLDAIVDAGGSDMLLAESERGALADFGDNGKRLAVATSRGEVFPVEARRFVLSWDGAPAFAIALVKLEIGETAGAAEAPPPKAEVSSCEPRDATALNEPEKDAAAGQRSPRSDALDKSEALATLGHEARAPLNSILGYCDIMLEEPFGPIGHDRYRQYIRGVRRSGAHLMSLLADATELAKIEAGDFVLSPTPVSLNDIVAKCVSQLQSQASDARVIVRTSLAPTPTAIVADAGTVRQMIVDLLGHALNTTRAGGQMIVSTGIAQNGDVVLRIRRNAEALSEAAIEALLQSARPQATAHPSAVPGPTLTLPLTRALAAANGARFKVTGTPDEGSLFELSFSASAEHRS